VEDLALTGQHVPTIASLVDVVCPMIYPSHFGPGFEGRANPGDDPAYFVGEGTRRFLELVDGAAAVRPWLQAFPYRVSAFDGDYIGVQVTAARTGGGTGWCLWNPSSRYDLALDVLPGLCNGSVPDPAAPAGVMVAAKDDPHAAPAPAPTAPRPVAASADPLPVFGAMMSAGTLEHRDD
jgi:hypothetical protein